MKANGRRKYPVIAAGAGLAMMVAAGAHRAAANDYPTADRADYVIGCMAANGNTQEALTKCACAIDAIAGLMPYKDYEDAKTALSLQVEGGPRMSVFAHTPQMQTLIQTLNRAQAEANIQCFR